MAEQIGQRIDLSPINATGNDRPSLKDLYDHVVKDVADKWEELGVQLLQEKDVFIILLDHPNNVTSRCRCVLKKWRATTNATWNQLITALRSPSVQLDYLASQLEQMLSTECESTSSLSSGENPCKLSTIDDIEMEFAMMTNKIKEALINNNVDVFSLVEQLCAISAVSTKKVPLFDDDVFEKIQSIDEFWRKLRGFWNIFDYDLLRYIIKISKCKDAQVILDDFLSKIDPSAIEDADLVLCCRVEHRYCSLKPILRIKINAEKCTLNVKRRAKEIVSEKYKLEEFALCFKGIKKGCVELLYYISQGVASYLLECTISQDSLKGLSSFTIISLHVNDIELSGITDTVKKKPKDPQSGTTLPDHDHKSNPLSGLLSWIIEHNPLSKCLSKKTR